MPVWVVYSLLPYPLRHFYQSLGPTKPLTTSQLTNRPLTPNLLLNLCSQLVVSLMTPMYLCLVYFYNQGRINHISKASQHWTKMLSLILKLRWSLKIFTSILFGKCKSTVKEVIDTNCCSYSVTRRLPNFRFISLCLLISYIISVMYYMSKVA